MQLPDVVPFLHLLLIYLRYAPSRVSEPLTHGHLAVFRLRVGGSLFQSLFYEREGQEAVAESCILVRRLKALRGGENVHALLVGELREAFAVHRAAPLLLGFERLAGVTGVYDEQDLAGVQPFAGPAQI